jgi:3-oxoadipate enol-lactonase
MSELSEEGEEVMSIEPTTGTLQVAGGSLYYEVAGEGQAVVLLHASVADCGMWDRQFGEFARRYRVIRYDIRGFGRSKTSEVEFSHREDLHALLGHLGVERAYVVGASRGAQIAAEYAVEHSEVVSALVLVAGGLAGLGGEPTEAEMALIMEMDEAEEAGEWERVAAMDVRIWADGPLQPEGRAPEGLREKMRGMCLSNYTTHATQGMAQPLVPPVSKWLAEIEAPTLIVVGDYDVSTIQAMAGRLAEGIAGARQVVIAGTAHMVPMEKCEEFNEVVLGFFGELEK